MLGLAAQKPYFELLFSYIFTTSDHPVRVSFSNFRKSRHTTLSPAFQDTRFLMFFATHALLGPLPHCAWPARYASPNCCSAIIRFCLVSNCCSELLLVAKWNPGPDAISHTESTQSGSHFFLSHEYFLSSNQCILCNLMYSGYSPGGRMLSPRCILGLCGDSRAFFASFEWTYPGALHFSATGRAFAIIQQSAAHLDRRIKLGTMRVKAHQS